MHGTEGNKINIINTHIELRQRLTFLKIDNKLEKQKIMKTRKAIGN